MDVQVTPPNGRIEVITGCMFSGKTEELISRSKRAIIAGKSVVGLKPDIDDRYEVEEICAHDGESIDAIPIDANGSGTDMVKNRFESGGELSGYSADEVDVYVIDEANFFDQSLVNLVSELAQNGCRVIISGLDLTFRGEPFEPVPDLLALADNIEKRHAVCEVCGDAASRTQRLIDGDPAPYDSPTIDVGSDEKYEPRCHSCHEVPR